MIKSVLAAGIAVFFTISLPAQTTFSGWVQSANTFRLNRKLSIHFDAQLRSTAQLEHVNTVILRPGLNYALTKKLTATLGYALVNNRRTAGSLLIISPSTASGSSYNTIPGSAIFLLLTGCGLKNALFLFLSSAVTPLKETVLKRPAVYVIL